MKFILIFALVTWKMIKINVNSKILFLYYNSVTYNVHTSTYNQSGQFDDSDAHTRAL